MTAQSKTLTDAERVIQDASDRVFGLLVEANATNLVIALDRAGLLVTDLHRRALEACEALAAEYGPLTVDIGPWNKSLAVGRESLAAKEAAKTKPRWGVVNRTAAPEGHYVVCERFWNQDTPDTMGPFTEAQARVVANALNALEQGFLFEGCKFEREAAK